MQVGSYACREVTQADGRLGEWRAWASVPYAFLESHLLCWPLTMLRATGTEWTLEEVATVVHLV